ncbi:MAG: glycosyltransferase, partial [Candidatus Gracilibacteria bacterium]
MRIILTGGGTGGHVIPNLAVIDELRKRGGNEIMYIGSKDGPEKKMLEKASVFFRAIPCGKLRRYFDWKNFRDAVRVIQGIGEAKKILKEFKPDKVFCKGGYVSLPVAIAA